MSDRYFWYNLIEDARKTDIIIDGLTIPFILGAKKYIDPNFDIVDNSIYELLNEIANSETDEKAVLKYSPSNQYIITLRETRFCKENLSNGLVFKNKKGDNALYVTTYVSSFGNTIEEISKALNEVYKRLMKKETFS
jgi:hypothetical protein